MNIRSGKFTAAAGALALVAGLGLAPSGQAQESDTLVVARSMDLTTLDPARAFCDTCQIVLSSIYDRLVDLGADNKTLEPLLASSWEVNDENTEIKFQLNPDATFADGSPVEPKDVKWSLERLRNLKDTPAFIVGGLEVVDVTGDHSLTVKLEKSDSEFINKLAGYAAAILNSDVAIKNGAAGGEDAATADKAENWFLENSAGAGPFILRSYTPDDELRLTRNENYWQEKPYFSEVVITQTADSVSQAQLLASGGADVATQVDSITAQSVRSGDVTFETVSSFNFIYLALLPGENGFEPFLTDKIREAITLAIDYDEMIEFTVSGAGDRISVPIPNGFPGTAGLPQREKDLDKARALLAEEGVPDGFKIEAMYPNLNVYGVDFNLMMQKVQQDVAEIGIDVKLTPATFPVWLERIQGDGLSMTAVYYAPDYFGSSQYAQYFGMVEGSNTAARARVDGKPINDPKQEELLQKALSSNGAEQEEFFHQFALEMYADNIVIPLVAPKLVLAYRNDIEGVRYSACCNLPLADIKRVK